MRDWARDLLDQISVTAALLDGHMGSTAHADSLATQRAKLDNVALTPSARVLAAMREDGNSFAAFGMRQSVAHAAALRAHPLSRFEYDVLEEAVHRSIEDRIALETTQTGDFDAFVEKYQTSVSG